MKRILFILCFMMIGKLVTAQPNDFSVSDYRITLTYPDYGYDYYDRESNISYLITFYEEERMYMIDISWTTFDKIEGLIISHVSNGGQTLSSGYFRREGEHVYLYDTATGLVMEASIEDVSLEFHKGYELLLNRPFSKTGHLFTETRALLDCDGLLRIEREARRINDYVAVTAGHYSDYPAHFSMCDLRLNEDGTFMYALRQDIKVLEGTWSQDGNLIILHDEHTDHDFYLIYEEPNLRTMLLPGDTNLEGTVLTPQ